jgi:hypothetical protein
MADNDKDLTVNAQQERPRRSMGVPDPTQPKTGDVAAAKVKRPIDPAEARQQQLRENDDPDNPNLQHPQTGVSSSELNSGGPQLKKQATKEAAQKDSTDNTKP